MVWTSGMTFLRLTKRSHASTEATAVIAAKRGKCDVLPSQMLTLHRPPDGLAVGRRFNMASTSRDAPVAIPLLMRACMVAGSAESPMMRRGTTG
jgi:hypothetical protein